MINHSTQINEALEGLGIEITGPVNAEQAQILSPDAVEFIARLSREFDGRRRALLARRELRQHDIDDGKLPDFLEETRATRESSWKVADIPDDLQDRCVEITGPVDRKMIINALNSGANVFMADFEDSNSPTWFNTVQGQINLRDAVNRTIAYTSDIGKRYELKENLAVLFVRPRGWHLEERHMLIDGKPVSASLFDFALYFFHNAKQLIERGSGPYFYLPKLENHLEARLWNDVFNMAQSIIGIPRGTIRATVLIETILAAFEMDEILFELREHSAGLNCGRWDYIFSFIKCFRNKPEFILPDRSEVTMIRHFLDSYVKILIQTCHRRGIHAMGGMAAQIPIKSNPEANEQAIEKVRMDKEREVKAGHDGTWVAHPGLIPIAKACFNQYMPFPNQIRAEHSNVKITRDDLLHVPFGHITEMGLRNNINVGIRYLEAWLAGNGCVPLYDLMEDAATAEISRSQVWQWLKHGARMYDGRAVTRELVDTIIEEELKKIEKTVGRERYRSGRFDVATKLFRDMMLSDDFPEFLTLVAYPYID